MKTGFHAIVLVVLTVIVSLTDLALGVSPPVREFSVARYTDIGDDRVFAELGTLSVDTGFSITTSFEAARANLAMDQPTLAAISKKFVVRKDQVDFLRQVDATTLVLFEFSSESYSAGNFPLYIIKIAGTGSGQTPAVSLSSSKLSLKESELEKAKITFSLGKSASRDTTIHFNFSGTAIVGKDFKSSALKTVTILKGSKSASITVTVLKDKIVEPIEKIVCKITKGDGYKLGTPSGVTLKIR